MRTRSLSGLFIFFLFIQVLSFQIRGQKNIEAFIEKNKDISRITQHQSIINGKPNIYIVKQISIKNDRNQVDEFLKAVEIDEDEPNVSFMRKRVKNEIKFGQYVFDQGKEMISFLYIIKDDTNMEITVVQGEILPQSEHTMGLFARNGEIIVNRDSKITINGQKVTIEEARKKGLNIIDMDKDKKEITPKPTNQFSNVEIMIPKEGYLYIDGKKYTIEEAREKGFNIKSF